MGERPAGPGVQLSQCGTCSHFQPAPTVAAKIRSAGGAKRTSQFRNSIFKSSKESQDCGGRLLIGSAASQTLPSEGDQNATGSSKLNVAPRPGTDSTQIS